MNAKVYIVGAGPGDPELITVKGKRLLEQADLIIYAGSLVPEELLTYAKEDACIMNSASMNLEEIVKALSEYSGDGKLAVRLHTGDPSVYGALAEQKIELEKKSIDVEVVPGVSSVFAAAAAVSEEFTKPGISQTLILTRRAGRTPVPENEGIAKLAEHKASMAIFLSISMIDELCDELMQSYENDTRVCVVEKASWKDERVIRGSLSDIADKVKAAGIKKTAILLVGNFLSDDFEYSKLYDKAFSHEYRTGEQ